MIPKEITEKILAVSKLEDVIPDLKKSGKELYTKCPKCGKLDTKKKKGLMLDPARQIAKCFSCGWGTNSAANYLVEVEGIKFPQALEKLAAIHGIDVENEDKRKERLQYEAEKKRQKSKDKKLETFADRQLAESGLTYDDVTVEIIEDGGQKIVQRPSFLSGTKTQYGEVSVGTGDDMLIYYYDLDGQQVKFKPQKGNRLVPLIRVRWQNPDLHKDKFSEPMKYQSPAGSGSHIYIPENIRRKYKFAQPIDILFIQEGEKKAEKSCKHGIPSIGIMGIQNIAGKDRALPSEIQLIVQKCEVKQICFIMDSDWNNLSGNLKNGDHVDQRPRSFFSAVKNFKEYMLTLVNLNISVEIWFAYVKQNEANAKGIDDLLVQVLQGKENLLQEDISYAMHDKLGNGKFVQMHKITTMNDKQLADLWYLNDAEEFAKIHYEQIKDLKLFKIRGTERRFNEAGKLEMAQKLQSYEQYWEKHFIETRSGDTREELSFNYYNCFNFLMNRGFWRIQMKSGQWDFIHLENRVIHKVDNYAIKDFITEFTEEIKEISVLNMIYRGGPQYLGHEKLSNLKYFMPNTEKATRDTQCMFFQEKIWEITAESIKEMSYSEFSKHVWEDKIIRAKIDIISPMVKVTRMTEEIRSKLDPEFGDIPDGEFFIDFTDDGKNCHFLQFLNNTSNFTWRKEQKYEQSKKDEDAPEMFEYFMNNRHLLNKLTAIGYLLHDYKNDSELKAVIAMDGKISEVGSSNGRTGKSIMGRAIEQIIPTEYIAAKNKKITEDNFLFGDVTEKTKVIFLDDVRANIDFEFFFPVISGKLKVNPKGAQPFTLEQEDTPKLFMTTNHAINGEGSSFRDRQAFCAFSDFYNDDHKPIDDFGKNFFTEWEYDQWNLFYNLMANCLQLYFQSLHEGWAGKNKGIVDPPMETLEKRRLRQQIGEDLLQWADATFAVDNDQVPVTGSRLNSRESRKELFDDFLEQNAHARKYLTATQFKKRILYYCKYKGYHFNPNKPNEEGIDFFSFKEHNPDRMFEGEADKSGGIEYFTIANEKYTDTY
ncbi:MAG: CHC2 zinc finger domain-containing protein [Mangrovibacterium sp.]